MNKTPTLFSYVVEHDTGLAPCAEGLYCTLWRCKYAKKINNVVELAQVGDWVVGTGGANPRKSAGNGKLVYAMRVDEKLAAMEYLSDARFAGRTDTRLPKEDINRRLVLISRHFYYFGSNAIWLEAPYYEVEKTGPRYKCKFPLDFVAAFIAWIELHGKPGVKGKPCVQIAG
jgi:hypothetical protein